MKTQMKSILFSCFTATAILASSAIQAAEIKAAVAANFTGTLQRLGELYEKQTGNKVVLSSGSSGALYAQITNGAPFDVFFSADTMRPEKLEAEGQAIPGSRFTYAMGVPVLWSTDAKLVDGEGKVLTETDKFRHIAIAEPRNAPYGAAAQEVMTKLGVWQKIESSGKLVKGQSIGQTHSQIATGAAELGFVALSQIKTPQGISGSHWIPPASMYTPIAQQVVLLKQAEDKNAAEQFLNWIKGPEARAVIEQDGYGFE